MTTSALCEFAESNRKMDSPYSGAMWASPAMRDYFDNLQMPHIRATFQRLPNSGEAALAPSLRGLAKIFDF